MRQSQATIPTHRNEHEVRDGGTELSVKIDSDDNFADYFKGIFPKALQKVKEPAQQ